MLSHQETERAQSQRYHSKQPGEPQIFDSIVRVVITSDLGKPEFDTCVGTEVCRTIQFGGSCCYIYIEGRVMAGKVKNKRRSVVIFDRYAATANALATSHAIIFCRRSP